MVRRGPLGKRYDRLLAAAMRVVRERTAAGGLR